MLRFLVLLLTWSFITFITFRCSNTSSKNTVSTYDSVALDSNAIDYWIQTYQRAQPAQIIPEHFVERYIQPALQHDTLYPFHPTALYHYGEVLYQDSQLVVLTFYYKLTEPSKDLAASFVASYQRQNNQFLDAKIVFGSSVLDLTTSLGYRLGFSCKSTINYPDQEGILLSLLQQKKYLYSQFTTEKIIEDQSYREFWLLNKKGLFTKTTI